jgi:hypothetical protein
MSSPLPRLSFALVVGLAAAIVTAPIGVGATQAGGLKIVVIEGEDAVNIIQQKSAVAPVVEVRDRNDLPVAGVPVTFTLAGGNTATFAGGVNALTVTTNAAGRATVAGFSPLSSGAVQINVTATVQGQTAAVSIVQTNYATVQAAQAAGASASTGSSSSASGAGSGGGGGLSGTTIGILGGIAAAGTVAALKLPGLLEGETEPPNITELNLFPSSAIQASTSVVFNFSGDVAGKVGTSWTQTWDFGDGTTRTIQVADGDFGEPVSHVYSTAGVFTVRLTITNHQGTQRSNQTTITVKSLSGRWQLGTTNTFYDFTQSGASFTGTSTAVPPRTITGMVQPFSFTETFVVNGITTVTTFSTPPPAGGATSGITADRIVGVMNGGGFNNTQMTLNRQ